VNGDETFTLCVSCGRRVAPDEPGVRFAVEIVRLDTFGGTDHIEGMGSFIHARCGIPRGYRQKDVPKAA
jgi:hypothetical protein